MPVLEDRRRIMEAASWSRSFRSVSARIPLTAFNMSGFIQPGLLLEQLQKSDVDGFNDRQLLDCPEEIDPLYEQLAAIPPDTITFQRLLERIDTVHRLETSHEYRLSEDGMAVFTEFHDEIVSRRQRIPDDENRRGILSKSKGQLARIALSMHCLEHAVQQETIAQQSASDTWSKTIEEDTVKRAVELINHFIEQTFTLMPPEEKHPTCHLDLGLLTTEQSEFVDSKAAWIKKLLQSHHETLTPSIVSQLRLMPPCSATTMGTPGKNRYPATEARSFLSKVAELGLGSISSERVERMTAKGLVMAKSSTKFRKRTYSDLEAKAQSVLKYLKLSEEEYQQQQSSTGADR